MGFKLGCDSRTHARIYQVSNQPRGQLASHTSRELQGSSGNKNYITFFVRCLLLQRKQICLIFKFNCQLGFISRSRSLRMVPSCVCLGIWASGTCLKGTRIQGREGRWKENRVQRQRPRLRGVEVPVRRASLSPLDGSLTSADSSLNYREGGLQQTSE